MIHRPATPDDVTALLEFWSVAGENAGRPADDAGMVLNLIQHDPGAVLVATVADTVVGTVIAGWDGWRANLYRLAVHPDHRGRGIARHLLDHAEARLASLGATRFCAMVLVENDVGARFWRAAGYVPQQDWRRWVKPAV